MTTAAIDADLQFSQLAPFSEVLLRCMQYASAKAVPRGLPRLGWVCRRVLLGYGVKEIPYRTRFRICCDSDSYHSTMFGYGIEDRHVDRLLKRVLRPGDVVIDVGANVGMVTLLACSSKRVAGTISAHCFEPDPVAFRWLAKNAALNNFDIVLNDCAVGASLGEAELTISTVSGWSTLAIEPSEGFTFLQKAGKRLVKVVTLDDYCLQQDLIPSLIKIDVEGFETQVLQGACTLLKRTRPIIVIEMNPMRLESAGSSATQLAEHLHEIGYELFHIDPSKLPRGENRPRWFGLPLARASDVKWGYISDLLALPVRRSS